MSASILNAKKTRRIARETGLDVVRAWGHGGYVFGFVTASHEHGTWNTRTGEWRLSNSRHYTSCSELFPGDFPEEHILANQELRTRMESA